MRMLVWLRRLLWYIGILLLILSVVFYLIRDRYRDVVTDLARTMVMNSTSDLTNEAIAKQIEAENIAYDRIILLEKDLDGRITALKTNISEVNRLKTEILDIINHEILSLDTSDIGIPLGSLFLPELLSGKGPAIPVHILSIRNSDADFVSQFFDGISFDYKVVVLFTRAIVEVPEYG